MTITAADIVVRDDLLPDGLRDQITDAVNKLGWRYGWHSVVIKKDDDLDGQIMPARRSIRGVSGQAHFHHEILHGDADNTDNFEQKLLTDTLDTRYQYVVAVWRHLQANLFLGNRAALLRCYANLHVYGVEGYPHKDSIRIGEQTIIIYCNKGPWYSEWGGETAFYDGDGEIIKSVMPKSGRVVIFPSEILHCARSVSRICTLSRRTLMYKVRAPA